MACELICGAMIDVRNSHAFVVQASTKPPQRHHLPFTDETSISATKEPAVINGESTSTSVLFILRALNAEQATGSKDIYSFCV